MFYNQPLATRFGTELLQHVDPSVDPCWDSLDIAVAWVRASGMAHLSGRLTQFLRQGGQLSVIVGIDLRNTTREGLSALLDLEQYGSAETFVYHNEAGSVFHPKLYLFRNAEEARLIVGSNNLTQAGLYVNIEAGLQVDIDINADLVTETLDALSSWKDTSTRLSMRLDSDLLTRLMDHGYVQDEITVRNALGDQGRRSSANNTPPLFASRSFQPPAVTPNTPVAPVPVIGQANSPLGTVLLMRLRMARGTQTQIPFRVINTFFGNATDVVSSHSGQSHGVNVATARGNQNTMKLEIPEARNFSDTLARFERTPQGIVYEVYDAGSPQGKQIHTILKAGLQDKTTQLSTGDAARATWWRFI